VSTGDIKTWLVAYDIREPRRLRRVHRQLRKAGATVQYSAFSVQADDPAMLDLLAQLERTIDTNRDDLRAYHLPKRCPVWMLGSQGLPEGVYIDAEDAARLLVTVAEVPLPEAG
jgi:CRISPR-associated protein Cas2